MDLVTFLATAGRTLLVYLLMLGVMRALGKRTVGNFAAFDLIVALVLGEVAGEMINGEVSLAEGTTAIGVIAVAQMGDAWLTWWDTVSTKSSKAARTLPARRGPSHRRPEVAVIDVRSSGDQTRWQRLSNRHHNIDG